MHSLVYFEASYAQLRNLSSSPSASVFLPHAMGRAREDCVWGAGRDEGGEMKEAAVIILEAYMQNSAAIPTPMVTSKLSSGPPQRPWDLAGPLGRQGARGCVLTGAILVLAQRAKEWEHQRPHSCSIA